MKMPSHRLVLSIGLAYVFLYFGIVKFTQPILWLGWIPPWMEGLLGLTRNQWLPIFGAMEVLLAALVLLPRRKAQIIGAALMAMHLIAVVTQAGLFNEVGVRDTGLLLMSVALLVSLRRE